MSSQARLRSTEDVGHVSPTGAFGCMLCAALGIDICLSPRVEKPPTPRPLSVSQSAHSVPPRRIICRGQDLHDIAPVVCTGWAAVIVMLSDGSRQIISFLLPGEMISATMLFDPRPHYLVEAITDVNFRVFNRNELKSLICKSPDLLDTFFKAWADEKTRADQLIVDLGRRAADERIARLILNLSDRLTKLGMVHGDPAEFEFPLRQHHIADATGLTPVHVSKVLTEFRRNGLIKIGERSITITDPVGFSRVADTR